VTSPSVEQRLLRGSELREVERLAQRRRHAEDIGLDIGLTGHGADDGVAIDEQSGATSGPGDDGAEFDDDLVPEEGARAGEDRGLAGDR
jgi:hypothetical protein